MVQLEMQDVCPSVEDQSKAWWAESRMSDGAADVYEVQWSVRAKLLRMVHLKSWGMSRTLKNSEWGLDKSVERR